MLHKLAVSTIAAMFIVMAAPAGADSVFISDAADSGGRLDIRSYQVSKDDGAVYLKQCMHRPFSDRALGKGNRVVADLRIAPRSGYLATTTYRAGRLRGSLIPYVDGTTRERLAIRVKVVRLNARCIETSIPRSQVWTQGELRFDTQLSSFYRGTTDATLLPR